MVDVKRLFIYVFIIIGLLFLMVPLFKEKNNINPSFNDGIELAFAGYNQDNTSNITLKNTTEDNKEYNLYYVYAKSSTVNYKDISITLNGKIYRLGDLPYKQDNNYYYFYILNNELESNQELNYNTSIYSFESEGEVTGSFIIL